MTNKVNVTILAVIRVKKQKNYINTVFAEIFRLLQMTKINNKGGFMFEKFRLKKLSKVVQSVISNLFEQIAKKDYFGTFSKINFLNIENVALLYKKNKNETFQKGGKYA